MKQRLFFAVVVFTFFSALSCTLDENKSYFRAVNTSYNKNYEDIITDIYLCEGASNDNYVSVWNGKLHSGETVKFSVEPGNYGGKFFGTRCYNSGNEKSISETTGYKKPVKFKNYNTICVTFDGNGIFAYEEEN